MDIHLVLLVIVLALQLIIFFSMRSDVIRHAEWRISRLDRKVDLVIRHLGIAFEDKAGEMVRPLVLAGKKMEAIKEYRRITGAGLKDSKQAIDMIELEQEQGAGDRG